MDTDNSLIKTKERAGRSMLAGGGSVKEVLTKSAGISSLCLLPKRQREAQKEREGMEEVVKREREVKEELLCIQVF